MSGEGESRTRKAEARADLPIPLPPIKSPRPRVEPAACQVKSGPLFQVSDKGIVSPVRFERTLPTPSRWCLLPLGYEDMEPPGGLEPPAFPLREGRSAR